MNPDEKSDDDNDTPPELEQGLAFAYGGGNAGAEDADADAAPSVLDQISAITGQKPMISLREAGPAGGTPMLAPLIGATTLLDSLRCVGRGPVFAFDELVQAHELMDRNAAGGKIVVRGLD